MKKHNTTFYIFFVSLIVLALASIEDDFKKHDLDKNEQISKKELKLWLKAARLLYYRKHSDLRMVEIGLKEGKVDWNSFIFSLFGLNEMNEEFENVMNNNKLTINIYSARWKAADKDRDNKLNAEEFFTFENPELVPRLRDLLAYETINSLDNDKDWQLNEKEFIKGLNPGDETKYNAEEKLFWKNQRDQFKHFLDVDGDLKLGREEVKRWITNKMKENILIKRKQVFVKCDTNRNKYLEIEEIKKCQGFV